MCRPIQLGLDPAQAGDAFIQNITSFFSEGVSQLPEMKTFARIAILQLPGSHSKPVEWERLQAILQRLCLKTGADPKLQIEVSVAGGAGLLHATHP